MRSSAELVRHAEGSGVWVFGEIVMETAGLNAVAGRPEEEYGLEPRGFGDVEAPEAVVLVALLAVFGGRQRRAPGIAATALMIARRLVGVPAPAAPPAAR